jgi:hypothetical protein
MAGLDRTFQTLNQLSQGPGKLVPYNVIIEAAQVLAEVIPDRFCKCCTLNLRRLHHLPPPLQWSFERLGNQHMLSWFRAGTMTAGRFTSIGSFKRSRNLWPSLTF